MLSVVAPGKLVLTLQSIPPFVVESILALTLAVLLALPLILRVQQFLDDSMKPASCPVGAEFKTGRNHDRVVTHYPVSTFDTASSSSVDLHLRSIRRTISSPILKASGGSMLTKRRNGQTRTSLEQDKERTSSTVKQNEMVLKQSSSFILTNSELPIIDISAFDYDAYRYKLMEAALKNRYEDYQPPGGVVLNSIHLNDDDSTIAVRLNDKYHHSLFDFVEEYYDATTMMSRKETEYMHPLDHFLVKGTQKPETVEKETETKPIDIVDAGQDDKLLRISFYDDTIADGSTQRNQDPISRKSLRSTKGRPSSAGADSTASKRSPFPRSSSRRSATKFSRATSSTDTVSSKRYTLSSSHRPEDKRGPPSSVDGVERESMNCTTVSSIDSDSSRSECSKLRDNRSCHSRDSSVTSKRYPTEKSRVQPWLAGNPRISFNKKYGNTGTTSSKVFEESRRNSTTRRSGILNKRQDSKQSIHYSLEYIDRPSNKNSTKFGSPSRTRDRKPNSQVGKLESIKSETEELLRPEFHSTTVNLSARPQRPTSKKRPTESSFSPRVRGPDTIDSLAEITRQPPAEPRLARDRTTIGVLNTEERSGMLKQGQTERRPWKVCLDRKQRSRTVSPVLSKQRSTRAELSTDTMILESHIPVASNSTKHVEVRTEDIDDMPNQRPIKGRQTKIEPSSGRLNACGKRSTLDSIGGKENEKKSDSSRGKASSTIKGQASRSNGRGNLSTVGKLSCSSKCSQQRPTATGGSRLNAGLHDNAIASRSMQIRSGKSVTGERRASRSGKLGKNETVSRSGSKENSPDSLRLPRRDSKAGIAMQAGLKKYIKKLKRVLSDREQADIGELASLSLTDAILPELDSALSSVEIQQVQDLLSMAEKTSEMSRKDLSGLAKNDLR